MKRLSADEKRELVIRILRGETAQSIALATDIPQQTLEKWHKQFLAGGLEALVGRVKDRQVQKTVRKTRGARKAVKKTAVKVRKTVRRTVGRKAVRKKATRKRAVRKTFGKRK